VAQEPLRAAVNRVEELRRSLRRYCVRLHQVGSERVPVLVVAHRVVHPQVSGARRAGKLRAQLQYGRINEILATGLHAFLTQFLDRVNDLGMGISRDFLIAT
jgi:uncharacterized alpha-E superfamily protein